MPKPPLRLRRSNCSAEYSPAAEADFLRLADRVSDFSIDGAFRLVDHVAATVDLLREFPDIGHHHRLIRDDGVRVVGVRRWLVVYRIVDEKVFVARIVPGTVDLSKLDIP